MLKDREPVSGAREPGGVRPRSRELPRHEVCVPACVRLFAVAAQARARWESETGPGWRDQIAPFQVRAAAVLYPAARRAAGRALEWPGPVA